MMAWDKRALACITVIVEATGGFPTLSVLSPKAWGQDARWFRWWRMVLAKGTWNTQPPLKCRFHHTFYDAIHQGIMWHHVVFREDARTCWYKQGSPFVIPFLSFFQNTIVNITCLELLLIFAPSWFSKSVFLLFAIVEPRMTAQHIKDMWLENIVVFMHCLS